MQISHEWLQSFFTDPLPAALELEDLLTFHSSEVEGHTTAGDDIVFDVKVLPDKSAWCLSHRGIAREIAMITGQQLARDPLAGDPVVADATTTPVVISRADERCDCYCAVRISDISIDSAPDWMTRRLAAIGQRSINGVVDITNYVMFDMGQPLHAFDAHKLSGGPEHCQIAVRAAREGEPITVLTGETYSLTPEDLVIVDAGTDAPIGIAGVKGGALAAVDADTTDVILEAAHFDRVAVRKTARRLNLRTDASTRFENGVSRALAPFGAVVAAGLIAELGSGTITGYAIDGSVTEPREPVTVTRALIHGALGLDLTTEALREIFDRFGYAYTYDADADAFTVTPPMERDDLTIPEDLVEEVGRSYGFHHVTAIPPDLQPVREINARHYYAESIRTTLCAAGFSEVLTSSFRKQDTVALANALASDKQYLRSRLADNLEAALDRNAPYRDLLGLPAIQIFELGTVFGSDSESYHLAIGVRTGVRYKAKHDDPRVAAATRAVSDVLGAELTWEYGPDGIAECNLSSVIATLPVPDSYEPAPAMGTATYKPFSPYPPVARDIAIFVSEGITASAAAAVIDSAAGPLRVRTTCFDEFSRDGRTSYAFRVVFQSSERTLTDTEVNVLMDRVYAAVEAEGWEVR